MSPAREGLAGGSGTIRGGAAGKGRPPGKDVPRAGTVDFRGNDWDGTAGGAAAGGNPPGIHDGNVEPTFEYKGKRYRMDRVLLR